MPAVTIDIPHQLDRAQARTRTEECVAQFRQQYSGMIGRLDDRWNGDTMEFTFVAMGESVTGRAHVGERAVRLEIDLPWILSLFAGGFKQSLEDHGRKLLEKR